MPAGMKKKKMGYVPGAVQNTAHYWYSAYLNVYSLSRDNIIHLIFIY